MDEALAEALEDEMVSIVVTHPGLTAHQIYCRSDLGETLTIVCAALQRLTRAGALAWREHRYWPPSIAPAATRTSASMTSPLSTPPQPPAHDPAHEPAEEQPQEHAEMTSTKTPSQGGGKSIRQRLIDALSHHPAGLLTHAAADHAGVTNKQAADNLCLLARQGLVTRDKTGKAGIIWRLSAGAPASPTAPRQSPPQAARPAARAHSGNEDAIESLLERTAHQAQDALDAYVAAVCDATVLGPLRVQRDAAREALQQYRDSRHA